MLVLALLQFGRRINTLADIKGLELKTYLMAIVAALVALAIAAIWSNAIAFEGGANPADRRKRRLAFWFTAAGLLAAFVGYQMGLVVPNVAGRWQGRFFATLTYATAAAVATYVLVGLILSKLFATSKLGNWFGSTRR